MEFNNGGGGDEAVGISSEDEQDKGKEGDRIKEKEKIYHPQAAPTANQHTTRQGKKNGGKNENNFTTSYTTPIHPSKPDPDSSPQYYPTVNDAMVSLLYAFHEQTYLLSNTTFGPLHEAILGNTIHALGMYFIRQNYSITPS